MKSEYTEHNWGHSWLPIPLPHHQQFPYGLPHKNKSFFVVVQMSICSILSLGRLTNNQRKNKITHQNHIQINLRKILNKISPPYPQKINFTKR